MAELERLDAVVAHAVSVDPEERYISAREMAADLALTLEPASPAEVASWVTATAHDVLVSRAEIVAGLSDETDPEDDAGPPRSRRRS